MVKYAFVLIILVHGLIHLIGFSKAFGCSSAIVITKEISKPAGILWMITAILLVTTTILLVLKIDIWWIPCLAGLILSQVLIFAVWQDAKFGSIANLILLLAVVIGYGTWHFSRLYKNDVKEGMMYVVPSNSDLITESDLQQLPGPVQKYIRYTGFTGKPKIKNFRLELSGALRADLSSPWMKMNSEQYNFIEIPSRLFFLNAVMKNLPVTGYHSYKNGHAFMDIRLLSLFRVEYQSGAGMDRSETVTYFNDMCCMAPGTLIDKRIKWVSVDGNTVKADFTAAGITISAVLYFNDRGELVNFISEDRKALQKDGSMKAFQWSTPLSDYKEINGFRLAGTASTVYKYPEGDFCYGKFMLKKVEINCR